MADSEMKDRKAAAQQAEQQLDQVYYNMLEGHPDGQTVLVDLQRKFCLRTSITNPVDPNATLVLEGERRVILYIEQRIARFQGGQK